MSLKKKVLLVLIVWLVPIVGSILIYKLLNLDWFEAPLDDASGGHTMIGGDMLELNAIFNPKHCHVIEAIEKETVELNLDGQLYNEKSKKELIERAKVIGKS